MRALRRAGLAIALLFVLAGAPALAAKLQVSNRGVDTPSCRAKASPCRSISRAVANAAGGDTILVGPWRYGDLDGDGILGELGEETGGPACDCLIYVDKNVTILSRDGAAATLIDGSQIPQIGGVAVWSVGRVVFGRRNRGFTIFLAKFSDGILSRASGSSIEGNVVGGGGNGVYVQANDVSVSDQRMLASSIVVDDNQRVLLQRSSVLGSPGFGVAALDADEVLERIVAIGNLDGGLVGGPRSSVRKSVFLGNRGRGLTLLDATAVVEGNSWFGNGSAGLYVENADPATAPGNYWGSPEGPGPDPADEVGGPGGAASIVEPFAGKEIRARLKPLR